MLEDFKKFALRGNAVDLAIGVIIGAAFGAIVNSLAGGHLVADHCPSADQTGDAAHRNP